MKQVLIVDDETIMRITLRSIIDWERLGYEIAGDAMNGEQALHFLKQNPVDLLITDMKMPVLDGIGLLKEVSLLENPPLSIVLSGYDDFQLVREAFLLGAYDYLLKSDINAQMMEGMLTKMNGDDRGERKEEGKDKKQETKAEILVKLAMGNYNLNGNVPHNDILKGDYVIIQFEIDDFTHEVVRFGSDVKASLIQPFIEVANQIPRVAAKCILGAVSASRYLMCYHVISQEVYQEQIVSTCNQLKNVWSNYMNLPVSAGISRMGHGEEDFFACMEEAGDQLKLRYLLGKSSICTPWDKGTIEADRMGQKASEYKELLKAVHDMDEVESDHQRQAFIAKLHQSELDEAKQECLYLICHLALALQEDNADIWSLFPDTVNYYEKLDRIDQIRNLEIWMNNYFRWITDYIAHNSDWRQADLMLRAKRFIMDNYANPELTLGSVAGYIGLNEKYFSSRFTKEVGNTFSNYLTEFRISKAKEMMDRTDLKIYEISQSVGYNNVEHFTRVFKKICKVSPGAYKRSENGS